MAENWAVKTFLNTANVPIGMRVDALKIQIFAALVCNADEPNNCVTLFAKKVQLLDSDDTLHKLYFKNKSKSDDYQTVKQLRNEILQAAISLHSLWGNDNSVNFGPIHKIIKNLLQLTDECQMKIHWR